MQEFLGALKRFGRVLVSVVIVGAVAQFSDEPKFLALIPLISGIGKYLRECWGLKKLPF